jgi:hypothetical protein
MAIHEFRLDFSEVSPVLRPVNEQLPIAAKQLSDVARSGHTTLFEKERLTIDPVDIQDFLIPGFRSLDEAMKMYWSGMRIPTKDAYRFLRVKVAGGDKTFMIWHDELQNGRARLPVVSISRGKESFNKDKFSPAYLPMASRFLSRRGNRAALVYRPVPFLVEYTLLVWGEHKRDVEYAKYQILTRFNPLAEFRMYDGHLQGIVTLRGGDSNDQSDKEATFDQKPLIKHEYSITAEAWLPLPERLVPTVLGFNAQLKDIVSGSVLEYAMALPPPMQ